MRRPRLGRLSLYLEPRDMWVGCLRRPGCGLRVPGAVRCGAVAAVTVEVLMVTVGKRIRALREMHELTQADLAKTLGLARTSITNLEAGRQIIQLATLEALASTFDVTIAALLGEADLPVLPKVRIVTICEVHCESCGLLKDNLTTTHATELRSAHIRQHLRPEEVAGG